jgi:hypothetical protein
MKDLLDVKRIWEWLKRSWATSFGCILIALVSFTFGYQLAIKYITEDCRFMGNFRDGPQAYSCQQRVR